MTTGRLAGALAAGAPALVFVGIDLIESLQWALIAAGVASVMTVGWRALRHQSLKQPLAGIAIVAVGAAVVSFTGEARGFFFLPALVPVVVTVVCVVTLVIRRPLTGLLLNRVSGGPPDWPTHRELLTLYSLTTIACAVLDAANALLQLALYRRSDVVVLAIVHVGTGPMFAAIVALTLTLARRALANPHNRTTRSTMSTIKSQHVHTREHL